MSYAQKIRETLKNGGLVSGTNVLFAGASTSAIMASAGSDFIWIDMEHGPIDYKDAYEHMLAAHSGGAAALIRVPANDPDMMKKTLDMGVDGVIFPLVRSAAETRTMVESCLYPPHGTRGWNPLGAAQYGKTGGQAYVNGYKDSVLRIIMLEHIDACRELDEILQIPWLDGIMIGPCDFSGSMGRLLDIQNPEQNALLDEAIQKCHDAGLFAGVALGCMTEQASYDRWLKAGVQMFSVGQDMDFIFTSVQRKLAELNQEWEKGAAQ